MAGAASWWLLHRNQMRLLEKRLQDYLLRISGAFPKTNIRLVGNEDVEPFFIVGSGRSGNTLLRRILNNHPDLVIPPENYELINLKRIYRRYSHVPWRDFVKIVYGVVEYQQDFDTFRIDTLSGIAREACAWPKNQRSLTKLIDRFYRYYSEQHKPEARRWGDKTPRNTLGLTDINSIFPKAQYIHIVRDPYDVVSSYVKAGIYDNYGKAAKRWVMSVNAAREFGRYVGERYMEVSYEDLVTEPAAVSSKVCAFLGVDHYDKLLTEMSATLGDVEKLAHHSNVRRPISPDSIGKGKREMSEADIRVVNRIISAL